MGSWAAFRRTWLPWEVYPVVLATGAGVVMGVGELYNKVFRNPTREYCAKMSRGGDGTLEGIEGKLPALNFFKDWSTEVFRHGTPMADRVGMMSRRWPTSVAYEIVDEEPSDGADNTSATNQSEETGGVVASFAKDKTAAAVEGVVTTAKFIEEGIGHAADAIFEDVGRAASSDIPSETRKLASIQLTKVDDTDAARGQPEVVEVQVAGKSSRSA